jgi:hypothetical protein
MKRNDETTIEKISTHWESREKGSRDISVQRVDSNLLYKKIKHTTALLKQNDLDIQKVEKVCLGSPQTPNYLHLDNCTHCFYQIKVLSLYYSQRLRHINKKK